MGKAREKTADDLVCWPGLLTIWRAGDELEPINLKTPSLAPPSAWRNGFMRNTAHNLPRYAGMRNAQPRAPSQAFGATLVTQQGRPLVQ